MAPETLEKKDSENQWIIYVVFVSDKNIRFRKEKKSISLYKIGTDLE